MKTKTGHRAGQGMTEYIIIVGSSSIGGGGDASGASSHKFS